jgi:hypothetical protein
VTCSKLESADCIMVGIYDYHCCSLKWGHVRSAIAPLPFFGCFDLSWDLPRERACNLGGREKLKLCLEGISRCLVNVSLYLTGKCSINYVELSTSEQRGVLSLNHAGASFIHVHRLP